MTPRSSSGRTSWSSRFASSTRASRTCTTRDRGDPHESHKRALVRVPRVARIASTPSTSPTSPPSCSVPEMPWGLWSPSSSAMSGTLSESTALPCGQIPNCVRGFLHRLRNRNPLGNGEISRVYRRNFHSFASPWWISRPISELCWRLPASRCTRCWAGRPRNRPAASPSTSRNARGTTRPPRPR